MNAQSVCLYYFITWSFLCVRILVVLVWGYDQLFFLSIGMAVVLGGACF